MTTAAAAPVKNCAWPECGRPFAVVTCGKYCHPDCRRKAARQRVALLFLCPRCGEKDYRRESPEDDFLICYTCGYHGDDDRTAGLVAGKGATGMKGVAQIKSAFRAAGVAWVDHERGWSLAEEAAA